MIDFLTHFIGYFIGMSILVKTPLRKWIWSPFGLKVTEEYTWLDIFGISLLYVILITIFF